MAAGLPGVGRDVCMYVCMYLSIYLSMHLCVYIICIYIYIIYNIHVSVYIYIMYIYIYIRVCDWMKWATGIHHVSTLRTDPDVCDGSLCFFRVKRPEFFLALPDPWFSGRKRHFSGRMYSGQDKIYNHYKTFIRIVWAGGRDIYISFCNDFGTVGNMNSRGFWVNIG